MKTIYKIVSCRNLAHIANLINPHFMSWLDLCVVCRDPYVVWTISHHSWAYDNFYLLQHVTTLSAIHKWRKAFAPWSQNGVLVQYLAAMWPAVSECVASIVAFAQLWFSQQILVLFWHMYSNRSQHVRRSSIFRKCISLFVQVCSYS